MKPFALPDDLHASLKAHSTQTGEPMTTILRAALAAHLNLPDLLTTTDARARGRWYVNLLLWSGDDLETTSGPHEITSTGELPQLAASFAGTELTPLVTADLYRLRQVLARVKATSARIPFGDGRICQIDVHREAPE